MGNRFFWVIASLGIGLLQAWDSGAFAGRALIIGLTLAGILTPTATIAADTSHRVRLVALVVGAVLLVGARMLSPVALNTLHLALFPAAVYILFITGLVRGARQPA
jgi:hypothetical protein